MTANHKNQPNQTSATMRPLAPLANKATREIAGGERWKASVQPQRQAT